MNFNTKSKKMILTIMMVALLLAACSSPEPVEEVMAEVNEPPAKSEVPVKEMSLENEATAESAVSPLVLGESSAPVLGESLTPVVGESSSDNSETETETPEATSDAVSEDEATVKAEEIRAAEKAKQEEELRIQQEAQEKARQEAEAALKAEQEKAAASQGSSSQAQTPAEKPAEKPVEEPTQSEPQSVAQQSGKYALNEYGNPSIEVLRSKVNVMVNPTDPALRKSFGERMVNDPNVRIPNPFAAVQPISPYIGQASPPANWVKPTPRGSGEYRWSPEAGCWRYYRSKGTPSDKYVSIYGVETWAQSVLEEGNPGCTAIKSTSQAHTLGIYGV